MISKNAPIFTKIFSKKVKFDEYCEGLHFGSRNTGKISIVLEDL